VANGGEGRGRRRRAKPIALMEPAGGETGGTVRSWRTTTKSRLHPIRRLPGGRVVKEEYDNGTQLGAPQDPGTDRRTTMSHLHQSDIWSTTARDWARGMGEDCVASSMEHLKGRGGGSGGGTNLTVKEGVGGKWSEDTAPPPSAHLVTFWQDKKGSSSPNSTP
jgi:hypothetical protein